MRRRPISEREPEPTRVLVPRMYRVDPARSRIAFQVRFLGVTTVRGSVPVASGTIVLSPEPLERSLRVRADASGIRTGLAIRDWHLRSHNYFHVRHHPEISFQATRIDQVGEHVRIVGTLVLRGIAREIDVTATVAHRPLRVSDARSPSDVEGTADAVRYESRFTLDRTWFAIATGGRVRAPFRHLAHYMIGRRAEVQVVLEGSAV